MRWQFEQDVIPGSDGIREEESHFGHLVCPGSVCAHWHGDMPHSSHDGEGCGGGPLHVLHSSAVFSSFERDLYEIYPRYPIITTRITVRTPMRISFVIPG